MQVVKKSSLQAIDTKLKSAVTSFISQMKQKAGTDTYVCIISDEPGFQEDLDRLNIPSIRGRIAIGHNENSYRSSADFHFEWRNVEQGLLDWSDAINTVRYCQNLASM